jgi:hypothetical protein
MALFIVSKDVTQAEAAITSAWTDIVVSGLTIAAAVLAGLVVRAVALRQEERQRRHPAGSPLPITAGAAP